MGELYQRRKVGLPAENPTHCGGSQQDLCRLLNSKSGGRWPRVGLVVQQGLQGPGSSHPPLAMPSDALVLQSPLHRVADTGARSECFHASSQTEKCRWRAGNRRSSRSPLSYLGAGLFLVAEGMLFQVKTVTDHLGHWVIWDRVS